MAVIAYQKYGSGITLSLVGEGLWRWALLPPDLASYTRCYNDFWTQLIRWMVDESDFLPGQNLTLRTDHIAYSPGDSVNLMAFVRGGKTATMAPVTITGPAGSESVTLSSAHGKEADFVGTFRPKAPGDYMATVKSPGSRGQQVTTQFSVYERLLEDMNPSADPDLMKRIAQAGGGKAISLSEIRDLPRLLQESAPVGKKVEAKPIWDRWPLLALILGLLGVEWIVRRRLGLV